jgi:hypothetical protein
MGLIMEAPDKLASTGIDIIDDNINTCIHQTAPFTT